MARYRIPIFAVVTLGLALVGLSYLSGRMAELSTVQVSERLAWGQVLFETSGRLAQSYRTAALAVAATDPSIAEAVGALKDGAPGATLSEPVRKAAQTALERLPQPIRRASHILFGNDKGVLVIAADSGAPGEVRATAFKLSAAGHAGPQGSYAAFDGKLFRVAASPLRVVDGAGEKEVGWIGAAFPLDDAFAIEQAKDLQLSVTLFSSGVAASSLPAAQRATAGAVKDGPAPLASPPGFAPIFTGKASLAMAKSFPLEGADGAQAVLIAEAGTLMTLADFQWRVLFGLAAIALFAVGLAALGRKQEAEPAREKAPEIPAPEPSLGEPAPADKVSDPFAGAAFGQIAAAPVVPPAAQKPAPEPAAPPAPKPAPAPAPAPAAQQPAAVAVPLPAPAPARAPQVSLPPVSEPASSVESQLFGSLPFGSASQEMEKPFDPFAAAAAQSGPMEYEGGGEATVTAAVPEELLRAAARPVPLPAPGPAAVEPPEATVVSHVPEELLRAAARRSAPGAAGNPEEAHFMDVFQQFVAIRTQCNEPSNGLTFDKFVAKLRKNRDQLIQKYNCKSVRFQVYVKDGKAALKATPVRE